MFTHAVKIIALVTVLGSSVALWAQSAETRQRKAEVDSLAERLAKVHAGQVLMSKRADSLVQAVTRLKAQPDSPLSAPALEAALSTSQTLAETLQKSQAEELFLDQALRQKAEQLLKNLSADLERLVETSNQAKQQNDKPRYNALKQELQICRQWQKRCQEILASPPTTILIYEVRVEPNDDANALSRKADFLRDQSDRLERESKRLEKKIAEFRAEASLRTRVSEFEQEVAMLEPSNEGLGGGNKTGEANTQSSGFYDFEAGLSDAGRAKFSSAEIIISLSWPDNASNLSLQNLSAWIKHLQHTQKRLRVQADSLRQRATDFETLRRTQQD